MGGPGNYHTKWSKSDRERQIYDIVYIQSLKKWYKWVYLQNRNRLTDLENELMCYLFSLAMPTHMDLARVLPCTWMPGLCADKPPTVPLMSWAWISGGHSFHPLQKWSASTVVRAGHWPWWNLKQKTWSSSFRQPYTCQVSRTPTTCHS